VPRSKLRRYLRPVKPAGKGPHIHFDQSIWDLVETSRVDHFRTTVSNVQFGIGGDEFQVLLAEMIVQLYSVDLPASGSDWQHVINHLNYESGWGRCPEDAAAMMVVQRVEIPLNAIALASLVGGLDDGFRQFSSECTEGILFGY
jgi:hypothetical protein